jgi:hypothetical protein
MLECNDCHTYFFTQSGLDEHDSYCIGYNPMGYNNE